MISEWPFIHCPKDGWDEFWKYHTEVMRDVMRVEASALKKYTLNRVTQVISGTPQFFALMRRGGGARRPQKSV